MEELKENNEGVVETNSGDESSPKTYSQEEVDKLIQSETDRRVTQALKTAEKKNNEKVREAQKLSQMNADEKWQYQLEQREKAIEEKERELALAENKNAASAILADKGLSLKLVDFVVDTDADVMDARIKLLDSEFKKSVKAEVEKRLGTPVPKKTNELPDTMTKDQFRKIKDINVLNDIKNNNPELWKELTN